MLHVGAQEVIESILDVGKAGLEVGERDDDLLVGVSLSSDLSGNGTCSRVFALCG